MDLYWVDCFPLRLLQRALHTEKLGEKKKTHDNHIKTFCLTHASLFWPPSLLHFDNRLEQNPKIISHASIQSNPGSWKRVIQDHCSAKSPCPFIFFLNHAKTACPVIADYCLFSQTMAAAKGNQVLWEIGVVR